MKKQLFKILVLILIFGVSGYCDNNTEFVVEDDLTINGTQGTYEDPDVELKGFVVIGATQPSYTANIPAGPGNVIINGTLGVSSGAYIVGNTTITYITSATFSGASSIFINYGDTGQILKKSSTGNLIWSDLTAVGDNLGNHIATMTLDMKNFPIINISSLAITGATGMSGSDSLLSIAGSTMVVLNNGNVGIGTTSPQAKLDIAGQIKIVDGTQGAGKVLTSDDNGLATWQTPAGDNLGNHIATMTLTANYGIVTTTITASSITITGEGITGSEPLFQVANATMVVLNNGNVGIGTTSPDAKLRVEGEVKSLVNDTTFYMVPKGAIMMWSGTLSSIPDGWQLCNVTNGTPDLRDRFVYGVSSNENPGLTGGTTSYTLTIDTTT